MEELAVVAVKQRYSAVTWKERVAACRNSGQGVAKWCAANGINSKSYYRWERKLLREAGNDIRCIQKSQQLQRFAELPSIPRTEPVAVLRMGEITFELHEGISAEQLSAIVQAMKSHA